MRRNHERGDMLISTLVAMAVMLMMLAAVAPALVRGQQVQNESAAAQQLFRIGSAETASGVLYGQYMTLDKMSGTLAAPNSCTNPNLLSGSQVQSSAGYQLIVGSFSGTPAAPMSGCPTGYSNYILYMEPTSKLSGTRFFAMQQDGIVYFAQGQRAVIGTNPYPVSLLVRSLNQYLQVAQINQPPPSCPAGDTGTYPNCVATPPQTCPSGYSGTYPNCTANPPGGAYNVTLSLNASFSGNFIWTGTINVNPNTEQFSTTSLSNGCGTVPLSGNLGAGNSSWISAGGGPCLFSNMTIGNGGAPGCPGMTSSASANFAPGTFTFSGNLNRSSPACGDQNYNVTLTGVQL